MLANTKQYVKGDRMAKYITLILHKLHKHGNIEGKAYFVIIKQDTLLLHLLYTQFIQRESFELLCY